MSDHPTPPVPLRFPEQQRSAPGGAESAAGKRAPAALRHWPTGAAAFLFTLAASGTASASGFYIDEQSARATGRGGAVTASPGGAASVFYNPAGLATVGGLAAEIGSSWVRPTAEFSAAEGGGKTQAEDRSFVLPQAYVSGRLSPTVVVGAGVASPFGLALRWPDSSPGRQQVREVALETAFVMATVAINLDAWVPGLSIGGGPDLVPAAVRLTRDILFGSDLASAEIAGYGFGIGGRVGLLYRPPVARDWAFGLSYRTPVSLEFFGDADFDAPAAYRASLPPDGTIATSIDLPSAVRLGVSYKPLPPLEFEVDLNWIGWSSYDSLRLALPGGLVDESRKDWKDSWTARMGAELTVSPRWALRLGLIWDQTPIPSNRLDFQLPDGNRTVLSAGATARLSRVLTIDAGVLRVLPVRRATSMSDPLEPPVKGRFEADAWVANLALRFELPGR